MGCKSEEERAEEYFQSGLALIEQGDISRATIEFRNVFELDSTHRGARTAMARLMLEQGNLSAAFGQYLRLIEQYPDDLEGRQVLAELAFQARNWEEFERHASAAIEIAPEAPRNQAIALASQYREAVQERDNPARQALIPQTIALLEELQQNVLLSNILIDSYTRDGQPSRALDYLDELIATTPDSRPLYNRRLALLGQMQDGTAIEAHLRVMLEKFPEDPEIKGMLLRYYLSTQDTAQAESFLREIASPSDEDPALFLDLINFVLQTKGVEAAQAEIARAIEVNPKPNRFKAMQATLEFEAGQQDKAIADLEALLAEEGIDTGSDETSSIRVILARMLVSTGNQVGARRLIEQVLADNSTYAEALKMQAAWQLEADEVDGAISNLRLALDSAPEDVQAMNLMIEAHNRLGNHELARDFMALAVEASGNAPTPSLRYAQLLIQEERYLPAEDVLLPALRLNPGDINLLNMLGQVYLNLEDTGRATQVMETLRRMDTADATTLANALQAELLNRQSGTAEAMAFLENLATGEDANLQSKLVLLRAQLSTGETDKALRTAQELLEAAPNNPDLKLALATTQEAAGNFAQAEALLRELTNSTARNNPNVWLQLSRLALRQGNRDEAYAAIDAGLAATGENPNILWAKASALEQEGDIDGAIGIYETLYSRNSSAIVVANNLASLLTTHKDDAESLERAWVIARRLRGSEVPAFQDTYGWIAFRRGDEEEALPYLEGAARGLAEDPLVQAHLGIVYAALERNEEALDQLQKALDLTGSADTRPTIERARAELSRLRNLPEN